MREFLYLWSAPLRPRVVSLARDSNASLAGVQGYVNPGRPDLRRQSAALSWSRNQPATIGLFAPGKPLPRRGFWGLWPDDAQLEKRVVRVQEGQSLPL